MMVVMLILTIVLAAFAPLMTKRKTVDLTSPWRYASNNSDIYYGLADSQTAMIGQNEKKSNEPNAKLTINTNRSKQFHILFKDSGVTQGALYIGNNFMLNSRGQYTSDLSSGSRNTAFGKSTLGSIMNGSFNTALGAYALSKNTAGQYNTAVGDAALNNATANYNTAVGASALQNNTGEYNVGVGYLALLSSKNSVNNVAVGAMALQDNSGGDNNVAIGYQACGNVTGSNKTCIGANSGPSYDNDASYDSSNVVYLGTSDSTVYIPGKLIIEGELTVNNTFHAGRRDAYSIIVNIPGKSGSRSIRFKDAEHEVREGYNNSAVDMPYSNDNVYYSDRRLKDIKGENKDGLENIRALKVYNYTFKNDKEKKPQVGVMAQDLEKIFPDAVTKDEEGYLKIRTDDIFYTLVNAVKQLDKIIKDVINDVKSLAAKVNIHDEEIKYLQEQNKMLEERIKALESKS